MEKTKLKILVTGGTGFIGSHVVDALRSAGHLPVVLSSRPPKEPPSGVLLALGDITDYEATAESISKSDGVIHLAGKLGSAESIRQPEAFVHTNVIGALNVFDACRFFKKRCVYVGVGNVMDNNMYAITKYTAERMALMYNKEHGTRIMVVRLFNAYGERQKAAPTMKLVPNAILSALQNKPIKIFGDGLQQNDFIYVKDVAQILRRAVEMEQFDPLRIYHLGTGIGSTILSVVKTIVSLAKSSSEIVTTGRARPGENTRALAAEKDNFILPDFSFTPLETGMRGTIDFFKSASNGAPALRG